MCRSVLIGFVEGSSCPFDGVLALGGRLGLGSGFKAFKSPPTAYDTHESVDVLNDHLICSECGGFLKKKYCSGSHKKIEKDITFTKVNPFDL